MPRLIKKYQTGDPVNQTVSWFSKLMKEKGSENFSSIMSNQNNVNLFSQIPQGIDTVLNLTGAKESTMMGTGDTMFNQGTTALLKGAFQSGNPYAIAGAAVLKGVDYLNRYAGKNMMKQTTDEGLAINGYQRQTSINAGGKATLFSTLFNKKKLRGIDTQTKNADIFNLKAADASYADMRNNQSSQGYGQNLASKNMDQLSGNLTFYGKKGMKIPPQYLSNIKKKVHRKIKKAQIGDSIDDQAKLKNGGQITNVIPEGALHARKNNYGGTLGEQVTSKGIPVITIEDDDKITQHAEIEHSEIIFHKEVSTTLEDMFKEYSKASNTRKKELEIECGRFLTSEILENTEDNVNLIEQV